MKKIIMVMLAFLAFPVFADEVTQYQPGAFYFSPGVAYYHFSEKRDLQNTAMANLSAGYVVSNQFSLEAFYGQAATEETPSSLDQDTRFYIYSGEGVYHVDTDLDAIIHPYILAGLSITNQIDDDTSSGNTTLLGVSGGFGAEYFVNSSISLFTDLRDIYTLSGGKNDWMLNAGIKFVFGGDASPEDANAQANPTIKTDGAVGFYQLQESNI